MQSARFDYGGVFLPYFAAIGCCCTATFMGQSWFDITYNYRILEATAWNGSCILKKKDLKFYVKTNQLWFICPIKVVIQQQQNQNKSNGHTASSQVALNAIKLGNLFSYKILQQLIGACSISSTHSRLFSLQRKWHIAPWPEITH